MDDPNDLHRIAWGVRDQKAAFLDALRTHLQSSEPSVREKARAIAGMINGEVKAFEWAKERKEPFSATGPSIAEKQLSALTAARGWLEGIDSGAYGQSWENAADVFRKVVPEKTWVAQLEAFRGPLGKLVSRTLISAQHTTNLPGAVGEHVVMQFQTAFANKAEAVETVTFTLEKDGTWKSSGYYIK